MALLTAERVVVIFLTVDQATLAKTRMLCPILINLFYRKCSMPSEVKGLIVGGEFGSLLIREQRGMSFEIGELFIAELSSGRLLLQVVDLLHSSQLSSQQLEHVGGMLLEESDVQLFEEHLRTYVVAKAKTVLLIGEKISRNIESQNPVAISKETSPSSSSSFSSSAPKILPPLFTKVRELVPLDLAFLGNPSSPLQLGFVRSGSRVLPVPILLDGKSVLSHHVLVTGTTGRGKSVFMANLFWHVLNQGYCGMLIFDPHDEYYSRVGGTGICVHPSKERLLYYSVSPIAGGRTLAIPISQLVPHHFDGCMDWTEAQREAMHAAFRLWKKEWISRLLSCETLARVHEQTIAVLQRRLMQLLRIEVGEATKQLLTSVESSPQLQCSGIFHTQHGQSTVGDIIRAVTSGCLVIVDTSELSGPTEILLASMLSTMLLEHYKSLSLEQLHASPIASIVLEEAPRVLGKEVLQKGPNIFATIAREGRKFNVGLVAITQLPSLIPRDILANLNTKVLLGTELKSERQAIIESAAQDLSQDERAIASLDKGEAIVTSTFTKFAIPIRVPSFEETSASARNRAREQRQLFGGMKG